MTTLDRYKKKQLVVSNEHAHYLYEQSYGKLVEKEYAELINEYLAEEKMEKVKHQNYIEKNYIRVGGI